MRAITAHFIAWYHQILLGFVLVFSASRQWWGRTPDLRALASHPLPSLADAPADPPVTTPAPDGALRPVASDELEQLLDRIGARHLTDLRELCDAFERVYAAELAAQDRQLAASRRGAEAVARERDTLAARVHDLERANTQQAAELRALSAEVAGRLAVTAAALGQALAAPAEGHPARVPDPRPEAVPGLPSPARSSRTGAQGLRRLQSPTPRRDSRPPTGADTPPQEPQGQQPPGSARAGQDAAITPLVEGLGARYVANLQELRDAFERVYAAEVADREAQLAELRRQAEAVTRERDALAARARDLEAAGGQPIAELRALSAEVDRRLTAAATALGAGSATPTRAAHRAAVPTT